MKLHRALSAAAVVAAIGSASLLASPVAYASGDTSADGGAPSASAPAEPSAEQPGTGEAAEDGDSSAGQPGDTAASPEQTEPAGPAEPSSSDPAASDPATSDPAPSATASTEPSPSATTPGATASPSPTYTRPDFCSGIPEEERGKTGLRGLPSRIVAGSGWHEFSYRVSNVSDVTVMETDATLYLGTADPGVDDVSELAVTVEWFHPESRTWVPVEGGDAAWDANHDFATVGRLEPGEYADARMRIRIAEDATAGAGYFFTIGHSFGADGQCGLDEISRFDFTVLPVSSEPGDVDDATGKPAGPDDLPGGPGDDGHGDGTGDRSPQGGHEPQGEPAELPVSGKLADTGSPSALPFTAAVGGAAVVAGAGAVVLVRRRRAAADA